MRSATGQALARTFETVILVLLLITEMAFVMGGWWLWLEYARSRA